MPDSHWEGHLTLNPADGLYYCPKHVTRCAISGCEKMFFDFELDPDFSDGVHCSLCPWEGTPYWCDEHIPGCQLCDNATDFCEACILNSTNGVFTFLCEPCRDKVQADPCSFAMIKGAKRPQ